MSSQNLEEQTLQQLLNFINNVQNTSQTDKSLEDLLQELTPEMREKVQQSFQQLPKTHPHQDEINAALNSIDNLDKFDLAKQYIKAGFFSHEEALNKQGYAMIHLAVWKGKEDVLLWLLDELKINVDFRSSTDQTALHLSVMQGDLVCFKILIDHGADIEAKDNQNLTPLLCASQFNRLDFIILLKGLGADLNVSSFIQAKDVNLCSVAHWAAYKNNTDILFYCKHLNIPAIEKDSLGMTPLHRAASSESYNTCREILKYVQSQNLLKECLNSKDHQNRNPLEVAISYNTQITRKMILDAQNSKRWSIKRMSHYILSKYSYLLMTFGLYVLYYYYFISTDLYLSQIVFNLSLICSIYLLIFCLKPQQPLQQGEILQIEREFQQPFMKNEMFNIPNYKNYCFDCAFSRKDNRSYHCQKCKGCIPMHDRHFALIKGCIGKSNRKSYYLFILLSSITWTLYLYFIAYNIWLLNYHAIGKQIIVGKLGILFINLISFPYNIGFVISLCLSLYFNWYTLLQTFCILINLTFYEMLCYYDCPYLQNWYFKNNKVHVQMSNIFYRGVKQNILEFMTA